MGVFRFAQRVVFCVGTLLLVTGTLPAQDAPTTPDFSMPHIGIPQDWSTSRVIYTRNGSVEDMMKVRNDPRFLHSYLLHYMREHGNQTRPPASAALNESGSNESGLNENGADENGLSEDRSAADAQDFLLRFPGHLPKTRPAPPKKNQHTKVDWAVSLGAGGTAIGESPAMYTYSATPACKDFVVYVTKGTPKAGIQSNLVGLTNVYSGTSPTGICGTAPTFLFSYAIGSGPSYLSPVLSLDGTKVAWIESTGGHAIFHVTTWVAGQGTNATTGSVAVTGTFASGACTPAGASCDVALDYTSSAYSGCTASADSNTNSDLYVDYPSDTGFIGADNGFLYHIKGIFKGTPTFDFCIPVHAGVGTAMSGTAYDSLLNPPEVFISDSKILYAYTVTTTGTPAYTLKASRTYANSNYSGPGPVLDIFNGLVYMFSAQDNETVNHTSMTQFPVSLASASVVPLGPASTNNYPILLYGAFDNNYYNNGPFSALSTLYTCGADPTTTDAQDLYAISFNATTGLANTTPAMSANKNVDPGTANGTCSPITEFYDGTNDRIFVGMGQHGATSGANVVQMWTVNSRPTAATTYNAEAVGYQGGTSGIVIDNNATGTAQAESLYFSTLYTSAASTTCGANNYCAVKLTQSLLQ
jgi:hypothetical protein